LFPLAAFLLLQAVAAPSGAAADYFQQHVDYTLEARLDEERDVLIGAGVLEYQNNSAEALDEIYFHLYLNAFRPNSVWARTERRENLQFQELDDTEAGFHRMGVLSVDGEALQPRYPHAPDSTVVAYALPRALEPGASMTFEFEWEARPSTLCRRQCRQGRSYDFAHWYPRVAVFDRTGWATRPLYPQGEMYGEYGTYHVTLDVADDQVIGATGVPVSGDPGWDAEPDSPLPEPLYRREFYGDATAGAEVGLLEGAPAQGRKRVVFHAEDVHHFAWSTSPDYLYEGGRLGDVAIHVLYRPGDLDWDLGAAVERGERALGWLQETFGPYPWPQLTILHRLESGGTEFPMVLMNGSASQGLIIHEGSHQYAHGIFGNNEWREGWLDEGMASFLSGWFAESHGTPDVWPGVMSGVGSAIRGGMVAPVSTESKDFPDFRTYNLMTYSVPEAILYMLRRTLGDAAFSAGLHDYYETKALEHVTEADLRASMERASGEDLGWFFDQWFHTTGTLDYAVGGVEQTQEGDSWRTRVEVVREGDIWMPIDVQIGDEVRRLTAPAASQTVEIVTGGRPAVVALDPSYALLDVDRTNNEGAIPPPR
jgi:hypothetical protein